jgi:hypothetical protein
MGERVALDHDTLVRFQAPLPEEERVDNEGITQRMRELMEAGKLIEAGWASFELYVLPADASKVQHTEMRKAFFAGAHHLFVSMLMGLDPSSEPTEADLARVGQIHNELEAYVEELKLLDN